MLFIFSTVFYSIVSKIASKTSMLTRSSKCCALIALSCFCFYAAWAAEDLLSEADERLAASLFEEAISMYSLLLQDHNNTNAAEHYIRIKLAQAYFAENKYAEAVLLLEKISPEGYLKQEKLYLLGLSYKNLAELEKAGLALNDYLRCAERPALLFYEEAQYELGLCYFLKGEMGKSRACFEALARSNEKDHLYYLAQIYLARIDLSEGAYARAADRLSALDSQISPGHVLRYELSYWLGETFFQQKHYLKAAECFEGALPKRHIEQALWYPDALYQLGWSYLKLGEESQNDASKKILYLEKAERAFEKFIKTRAEERGYLALAKIYVMQHHPDAIKKAEAILSNPELFISLESQANVLWLKAESTPDYETRNEFYKKGTDEVFRQTAIYPYVWYARGLNDFNDGVGLLKENKGGEAAARFEVAGYAFKQAFNLLKSQDMQAAGLAVKYLVETYLYSNAQEGKRKAFSSLDQLINKYPEILASFADPGEMYYLHAAVAAGLTTWQPGDKFADIAENSLEASIDKYPAGPCALKTLYLLGTVLYHKKNYAKAEQVFRRLTDASEDQNPFIGDAYFWTAKCMGKQKHDQEKAKELKKKVFEAYPSSSFAAEAYFTYYNYRDYLQGDRAAMKHLLDFEHKFPNSPFIITAYYLIGMDYKRDRKTAEGKWIRKKNLIEAIEAFQTSETAFDHFFEANSIPQEELPYFINIRYHCTLERALANLAIAEESQGAKRRIFLDYAEEVFRQIAQEFKDHHHPLTKTLLYKEPYPRLLEESSYWLAQTYIKAQNDATAELVLSEMIENYRSGKITRGYFLSRVRYDLGLIEMRRRNFARALELLIQAEDAAKGKILSVDQKIDMWIQQSHCYREMHELDKSMLLLSKAINDDAISSLRIKAMYLRAEIYALQGRHELARKQLEAASKNGGEWALKAKNKLDEDYGYQ